MPVMDYRLLYESMLTQKQEMDAQHELLGNEVKRLKSVIAKLEKNATTQALALKAAKAMQQAETERADANEAKIDALMFEHCPDEMTDEQKRKWAISQAMSNL